MLKIRPEQMETLAEVQLRRLERDAIAHVQEFWSEQAKAQGEDGVRSMVQRALQRSDVYGIEEESDVLRFINLMYALGDDFDTEQPWAAKILADEGAPGTERMDALCDRAVELLDGAEAGS